MENIDEEWKDARVNKISGEFNLQDRHVSSSEDTPYKKNAGLEKWEGRATEL